MSSDRFLHWIFMHILILSVLFSLAQALYPAAVVTSSSPLASDPLCSPGGSFDLSPRLTKDKRSISDESVLFVNGVWLIDAINKADLTLVIDICKNHKVDPFKRVDIIARDFWGFEQIITISPFMYLNRILLDGFGNPNLEHIAKYFETLLVAHDCVKDR